MTKKLVIDGKELLYPTFATANFDGDRVSLPARFIESAQLAGSNPTDCWLLVVTAGRYRLLVKPSATPETAGGFARVLREWEENTASGDVLDGAGTNERAGICARLIPTMASPMGTGWRVTIPKEARMLMPTTEDHSFVFVILVAGFIEFWFPDTLRRAMSVPIADLFS
ncbi:MAG: hypothetical protein WAN12_00725 [Candidatus Acidiferrum sp.]